MTKKERQAFASYMGKLSHKKSPRTKEHYSAMGKASVAKRKLSTPPKEGEENKGNTS